MHKATETIIDRLTRGEVIISDGGTGTYLQSNGLEPGGCPELMNVEHPDVIRKMAKSYFAAGSDMVLTNSFGGNRFGLERYGFGSRVRELNRTAAEHARSQAKDGQFVAGSVGPTGLFMEPMGSLTESEMYDGFAEQISALAEGGADAVAIETMISPEEAEVAIRAAHENTELAIIGTMTFDKGPRGLFTMWGNTPTDAVQRLDNAGADIVGANCGNGIKVMIEIAVEMRKATDKFLIIHSNAGIPSIVERKVKYPETPEFMASGFKELADLGTNIVGGCCGTTPAHIGALREAVKP